MTTPPPTAPRLAWWLATGFGSGYLRPAPGTWGSLAGLTAWLLLLGALQNAGPWAARALLAAPLVLMRLGVWAADRVVQATGEKDPSFIVVDEWAGLWIALTPLAFSAPLAPHPALLAAARLAVPFLLFRLFDIWKPGPIDAAQRLPGGWGVMMDDVLAGLLAALITWPVDRWLTLHSLLHPARWGA